MEYLHNFFPLQFYSLLPIQKCNPSSHQRLAFWFGSDCACAQPPTLYQYRPLHSLTPLDVLHQMPTCKREVATGNPELADGYYCSLVHGQLHARASWDTKLAHARRTRASTTTITSGLFSYPCLIQWRE